MIEAISHFIMKVKVTAVKAETAYATAATTTGISISDLLELIPNNIGKLGVLMGVFLTATLTMYHIVNIRKTMLEYNILRDKEYERIKQSLERQAKGDIERREP